MASRTKDPYAPLRSMPFMFWHDLSEGFEEDPVIFETFVDIMAHLARTPDEWLSVESFYESIRRPGKARHAGRMVTDLARDYEDWLRILECSTPHSIRFSRALTEVSRRCRSFRQFLRYGYVLWTTAGYETELGQLLPTLMRRAKTFDQWFEVWRFTAKMNPVVRNDVRQRLDQVTSTPKQLESIRQEEWWLDPKNRADLLQRMQLANLTR